MRQRSRDGFLIAFFVAALGAACGSPSDEPVLDELPDDLAVESVRGSIPVGAFRGSYYDAVDFTRFVTNRTDAVIDFDWGSGSPMGRIGADTFSVKWVGDFDFSNDGVYQFQTLSDDGIRVWIDDVLVVDLWTVHAATESDADVSLNAGRHRIAVAYFENVGAARAKVSWSPTQSTIAYDANGVAAKEVGVTVSDTTASGAYTILTNHAVTFNQLVLAVRDSANQNRDFIWNGNLTVSGSRTFSGSTTLPAGNYTANVAYTLDGTTWFTPSATITFTVASTACVPTTCVAQGKNCGTITDGCGGTLTCGSCVSPATCGGGGTANVCGGGSTAGLTPPAGYSTSQLIFEDRFTSATLDTAKWNPWIGQDNIGRWGDLGALPSPYSAMNCPNNTCANQFNLEYYDPYPYGFGTNTAGDHLLGGNGQLSIIAKPSTHFQNLGYSWASGAVTSYGKAYLPATGGYVQWRAKMPDSRYGAWAGLWLLSANGAEFDVQESGFLTGTANPNNVLASHWVGDGNAGVVQDTGMDLSAAFHVYGLEYIPGVSWKVYLDGKLMATFARNVPTNAAYQLLMQMAIAGPAATGWRTISDPVNHPGPFAYDITDVQIYRR